MASVGYDFIFDTTKGNVATGRALTKAASIIFATVFLSLAAITILLSHRIHHVLHMDRTLVYAALASLPFLLVRVAYIVSVSFARPGSNFYFRDVNVYISAFMQFLMEVFVVTIFITAGLITPTKTRDVRREEVELHPVSTAWQRSRRQRRHRHP
jgi:predicted neutral ceramidase superfamily lipid hydrolase